MDFLTIVLLPILMFFIALFGLFINRKNILLIIICIELALLTINYFFLISSFYLDDVLGQIFAIFIITVAAAESSIGLAILVVYYRFYGTITIQSINLIKG